MIRFVHDDRAIQLLIPPPRTTLVKIFVTYVAREADCIGSSSLRNIADVAFFT
jgi:hypothetical protein